MTLGDEVQTLLREKKKHVSSKLFPFNWIPVTPIIMLSQISLCVFAWTFVGIMMHQTIALPDNIAYWIQNHSSDTQTIVTLLSTILALINSSLLGKAVQYALVHRLSSAQLRLHTMVEWAKLAQRSLSMNFDRRRLSWTLLSIAWVSLLGFLTTAWSSLLAPQSVVIYYDFQGSDTDLLSPSTSDALGPYINEYQSLPGFNLTPIDIDYLIAPYRDVDLTATLMDAGFWAASANVSLDSYEATNFISVYGSLYVSNISTGGILPTGDHCAPYYQFFGIGNPSYQGLSKTYNVTQRGFTADVSCRTPMSNDPTITLNLMNQVQINASDYDNWIIDTYSWGTNCSPGIDYSTMGVTVINDTSTDMLGGLLMTSVCFGQSFAGPSNQSFLVLFDSPPTANYSLLGPQICQVTPLITTVQTVYDQTSIVNVIQPPVDQQPLPDPTGDNVTGILFFPAFMVWSTFVRSQGLSANMMGDKLLAFNLGGANYTLGLENYLQGMMEYLGSLMAELSYKYSFAQASNPASGLQFYATANVHTFGWTFHLRTHGPSLAAITIVTLLTVAAGAFAMMPVDRYKGASTNQELRVAAAHAFNPTVTMDVLLASSAGGLARVLSESIEAKEGDHDHGREEGLGIVLGMTATGKPALRIVSVDDDETGIVTDAERRGSLASRDNDRLGASDVDDGSRK